MKNIKIAILLIPLVLGLRSGAMEPMEESFTYTNIDRSRANTIIATRSDGIVHQVQYNPATGEYTGTQFRRVQQAPGARIPISPAGYLHLPAQQAKELYKQLSRVEKG